MDNMKWFLVVLSIFIYATASSLDAKTRMEDGIAFTPTGFFNTNDFNFMLTFIQQIKLAFGDIDTEDIRPYDLMTYTVTLYALCLITLLMMNILIGIISESVSKVYSEQEKTSNY
jgi:hypothetical protein